MLGLGRVRTGRPGAGPGSGRCTHICGGGDYFEDSTRSLTSLSACCHPAGVSSHDLRGLE